MAGSATRLPEEDRPDIDGGISGIRAQENGEDSHAAGHLDNTDTGIGGQLDPQKSPKRDGSDPRDEGSKYNADGDEPTGRLAGAKKKTRAVKGKLKSLAGNKLFVGAALSSTSIFIILLIAAVLLVGSLKIPNVAEHITSYQFARITRNYAERVSAITADDAVVSTAERTKLQKLHDKYSYVKDKTWGSMWEKINNYRPGKIVDQLQQDGTLQFKYSDRGITNLWKKKLTAVVIDGKEIPYNDRGSWSKLLHPLDARAERLAFSASANESLAAAMPGRGLLIRGAVAREIRAKFGIKLKWWDQRKFAGKSEKQANATQQADAVEKISTGEAAGSEVEQIANAAKDANKALKDCLANEACTAETVKSEGKLPGTVTKALSKAVETDVFQKSIAAVNPVYAIGLPVCLIYDGSLQNSSSQKDVINTQDAQLQRTYNGVATAADQQKFGDTNGEAVGAMNWKLGDITNSNPEKRSAGIHVDTSDEFSAQGSATGEVGNTVSIFDFLPSPGSDLANGLADSACPVITKVWVGGLTAAANLVAGFFSGGVTASGETIAEAGLKKYLQGLVAKTFTKKEGAKLGLTIAGTVGATYYAEHLTAQKAALQYSGLATGGDFVNDADKGGNLYANQIGRGYFGRPLTHGEASDTGALDRAYVAKENSHKSVFERYFAVSNPDSLITKSAFATTAMLNRSIFTNIFKLGNTVLSPVQGMAHLFGSFNLQHAVAASNQDLENYNQVQFGWSKLEENLLKFNPTFGPLENQNILEANADSGAIEAKYGRCFDTKVQMGDLLTGSKPDIARDKDGDVIRNKGLCSPDNLSYKNDDFGPSMVFRWRVEKSYEKVLDNQLDAQEVTTEPSSSSTATSTTTTTPTGGAPTGDAQQLAQQILDRAKTGQIVFNLLKPADANDGSSPEENIKETARGEPAKTTSVCGIRGAQPPVASVALNPDILKFILEVSNGQKFQINALAGQCHGETGSNHYKGLAVDTGCPFDTAQADIIGKKYGISMYAAENCKNNGHFHYSVGGN